MSNEKYENADYIEEEIEMKNLTPFKMFTLTKFPFIEETFDSLNNYQFLSKVVEYLNKVINNNNNVTENTKNLYNAYLSLQIHVNDYFENLDVLDEINIKLDKMVKNGTMSMLVANSFNYNPTVVDSITKMTDKKRIYINSSDGHKYYHNGTEWVDFGLFQAVGIDDGSIDLNSLNENISDCFSKHYRNIELDEPLQGYYTINGNAKQFQNNESFTHFVTQLSPGILYRVISNNAYNCVGLIVENADGQIIYDSNPTRDFSKNKFKTDTFKLTETATAYLSMANDKAYNTNNVPSISIIDDVTVIPEKITTAQLLKDIGNFYIEVQYISSGIALNPNQNVKLKFYQMLKGLKYKIKGKNFWNGVGLVIVDENFNILYSSSNDSNNSDFTHEFISEKNGYIYLLESAADEWETSIECYIPLLEDFENELNNINDTLNNLNLGILSNLNNKLIACNGDSIMATNTGNGGIAGAIQRLTGCEIQNIAVGGGTVAYYNDSKHCICRTMSNLNTNAKIILLDGGINDYFLNVPMGTLTDSFTNELDDTTFIGALESIFRYYMNNLYNSNILYVIPHKSMWCYSNNQLGLTWNDYIDKIHQVCEKYSIPVIDLSKESGLNTKFETMKNNYCSDEIHPIQAGYDKFYAPIIASKLENLYNKNI